MRARTATTTRWPVALRKESVDRNMPMLLNIFNTVAVALRKESVDRNISLPPALPSAGTSLSARRAWIEIEHGCDFWRKETVALRKESVDRNTTRAGCCLWWWVALRKESVDRNIRSVALEYSVLSRSPQGERG